jgi:hypothetical protein
MELESTPAREKHMSTTTLPHLAESHCATTHGASQTSVRELDHRTSDGIDVTLRWDPLTNGVSVAVRDDRRGDSLAFEVDPADALCAFHHPYAHAANLRATDAPNRGPFTQETT